jgi:hypothetical protein
VRGLSLNCRGYTNGQASESASKTYQVITDIRVYQGDYMARRRPSLRDGGRSFKRAIYRGVIESPKSERPDRASPLRLALGLDLTAELC